MIRGELPNLLTSVSSFENGRRIPIWRSHLPTRVVVMAKQGWAHDAQEVCGTQPQLRKCQCLLFGLQVFSCHILYTWGMWTGQQFSGKFVVPEFPWKDLLFARWSLEKSGSSSHPLRLCCVSVSDTCLFLLISVHIWETPHFSLYLWSVVQAKRKSRPRNHCSLWIVWCEMVRPYLVLLLSWMTFLLFLLHGPQLSSRTLE